jgi:hypothetical protein
MRHDLALMNRQIGGSSSTDASDLPRWFAVVLNSALALVAGFGLVGLGLAVVGAFLPVLVVPLGGVAAVVFARWGRSGVTSASTTPAGQLTSVGAAALAVGFAATSIVHAGQHVLIDRDPGAYLNTGRWLAGHSSLAFRADVGAFRGTPGLVYNSSAVDGYGPTMHFQFAHLLGVLLAEARWLGGDGLMFALVPILGAFSIALFYAVACRFVRPPIALVATAALACNVVQLHFSRDAYSEIVLQVVLLGSVWLLSQSGLDRRRSLCAGILLGTTVAARIDGPLYLAAVPVVVGIALARGFAAARGDAEVGSTRLTGTFCGGAAAVVALAAIDVTWRSTEYARSLGVRAVLQYGALAGTIIAAAFLARGATRWRRWFAARAWLPSATGAAFAVALLAAWFVRPYVQHVRGAEIPLVGLLQRADHIAYDPGRHYYENSLRWLAWYIGPPALAAGIVGVGRLIRDTLRHGAMFQWVLTMAFAATGAVYLWNANALPDQLWVTRRFVPIVLPGFILGAALTLDWLVSRRERWGAIAGVLLGITMLAWPISATAQVPDETTQANLMGALNATCRAIGPHAAVVVMAGNNSFDQITPQAIRSFCGVPAAIRRPTLTAVGLEALARRFRSEGRNLDLLADTPERITAVFPGTRAGRVATVVDHHELEQTLAKPPRTYWTKTYTFAVAEVPLRAP